MTDDLDDFIAEQMKDPDFRVAYEAARVRADRERTSRLWAEDWGSPEDSVYDDPAGAP